MHSEAYEWLRLQAARLDPAPARVLEIGGRDINGSPRDLFPDADYWSIDLVPGPGVDEVADGASYTPTFVPDLVVCCEVLEHAANARAIVRNAYALLPVGGVLLLTAAGHPRAPHSATDGGELRPGEYYRNVSVSDLAEWLADADDLKIATHPSHGDVYARAVKA